MTRSGAGSLRAGRIGGRDEGREAEFVAFVQGSSSRLLHVAWLLVGDRTRAEDLVQTTFARVYAAWGRVRADGSAYAYARRTLVNAHRDHGRRGRWREHAVADAPDCAVADSSHRVDDRRGLVAALARLSARERQVLVLRYYADLDEAAVAAELGITRGTVKSTASRALAKLRDAPELVVALEPHASSQPIPVGGVQ